MAGKFQDSCAYPPRMMNADRASAYLDISKTKFLEGVASGIWPAPRDVGGLPRWETRRSTLWPIEKNAFRQIAQRLRTC